jgi:tetratricopeptide (TPR) repeat protein
MSRLRKTLVGLLGATLLLTATGCSKLRARHELSKGTQAYKNANYEQAIEYFKNAVSLDSKLRVAKLYLATAYSQQYVPGVDNPENNLNAERAIEAFRSVLAEDPKERHALKGTADLYASMKSYDDAREYYQRAITANPNDADNYYSVAVVDWTAVYRDIADRKAKLGLGMAEQLKDKQICDQIRAADGLRIEEAIRMLQTSLEKRPDDEAARNYMNLLNQRKADMECSDPQASGDARVHDQAKSSS